MAHVAHLPESLAPDGRLPWRADRLARAAALVVLGLAVLWSFRGTFGNPNCQDHDFGA